MTVGILGGAFDPPHIGHVVLAREAIERFRLERLVALGVAEPAHKPVETPVERRLELVRAAFRDVPEVDVVADDHAYTVDFLRQGDLPADAVFIIGADELADFLTWREPDEILRLVRLGVATRPGYPREQLDDVLARLERPERVEVFQIPAVAASSTEVRTRVAAGRPIDDLVPPEVARLIVAHGLYHGGVDPRGRAKLR
ncbi:MAG: nicotinate-nicotinamide nucleotide adenylyltransferase [Gaiellaceae bacterium]